MFGAIAAKIGESLLLGKLKSTITKVPAWFWWTIAGIVTAILLIWLHSFLTNNFEQRIRLDQQQKDDAIWNAKLNTVAKTADAWRTQYEVASLQLSNSRRNSNEEALLNGSAHAGSLLSQGSGAAHCGSINPTSPANSSSGHEPTSGTISSGLDPVSQGQRPDLIAVPYNDFVTVGQSCDANRSEVNTWRADHSEQENLYNQLRNTVQSGK